MRAACGTSGGCGCGFEDGGLRHASTSNLKPHGHRRRVSIAGPCLAARLTTHLISVSVSTPLTLQH